MYQFQLPRPPGQAATPAVQAERAYVLPSIVYGIGISSMLADISAEMVVSALPMYLFGVLQISPLLVGLVDGIYQGGTALVRLVAAALSDGRFGARCVAAWGYGLSAVSRLLLASTMVTGLLGVMAALLFDRVGKGIRTAPRDALIAGSVPHEHMGRAFGVHRRLDAAGALLGPLAATGVLLLWPMQFELLFIVAALVAVPGLVVFMRFTGASSQRREADFATEPNSSPAEVSFTPSQGLMSLLREPWLLKALVLVFAASLCSISDGLLYVAIQRSVGLSSEHFPLLSVVSALGFLLAAAPMGRMADRVGAVKVYLAGIACSAVTYLVWASGIVTTFPVAVALVLIIGVYYAATDGVIVAAVAARLSPAIRSRGLALLATSIGSGKFLSSLLFGALWTNLGVTAATLIFSLGLALVAVGAVAMRVQHLDQTQQLISR